MEWTNTLVRLNEAAERVAELDRERASAVLERTNLIRAAWVEGHKLDDIALVAGLSRGRISQIMDPRARGRPRRDAGIEPRQPGRRPKEEG